MSRSDVITYLRSVLLQLDGQAVHWPQAGRFQLPGDRAGNLERISQSEADAAAIRRAIDCLQQERDLFLASEVRR